MVIEQMDAATVKVILQQKLAECRQSMQHNSDDLHIEPVADELDNVVNKGVRELALQGKDRISQTIQRVRAALQRIEYGQFGLCVRCEESISAKRLKALPWAERCIKCEESHERELAEHATWGLDQVEAG